MTGCAVDSQRRHAHAAHESHGAGTARRQHERSVSEAAVPPRAADRAGETSDNHAAATQWHTRTTSHGTRAPASHSRLAVWREAGFCPGAAQVAQRHAAVLVPLFEDGAGVVQVVLTQRAHSLSSHGGALLEHDTQSQASRPNHTNKPVINTFRNVSNIPATRRRQRWSAADIGSDSKATHVLLSRCP